MKREIWIGSLILKYFSIVITFIALFSSCTKDDSNPVSPPPVETITDIDGNVYRTVVIGTQVWMAENLKVTHYRNEDPIPNIIDGNQWRNLTTGAYCVYENNNSHVSTYGLLYNGYAVEDSHNIAPTGWHVPTDDEWKELEMYLGMSQSDADDMEFRGTDEGGKMKEAGTTHWHSPNIATNESGLSLLPGGCFYYGYRDMGIHAIFWCSTEDSSGGTWSRYLDNEHSDVARLSFDKSCYFSVRCVKD